MKYQLERMEEQGQGGQGEAQHSTACCHCTVAMFSAKCGSGLSAWPDRIPPTGVVNWTIDLFEILQMFCDSLLESHFLSLVNLTLFLSFFFVVFHVPTRYGPIHVDVGIGLAKPSLFVSRD